MVMSPWLTQTLRMGTLTFSLIGLQFTWSVEMTYFTPYLLDLGLAKSQTALVWLAPPLSGMIVQPIIGSISDSSTLRWGRRRPYMFAGSCLVAMSLLTLGWAPEVCRIFIVDDVTAQRATVALAVFCIYAMDFAINVVQATSRSLIVDVLPLSEQQLGSAWAGRMLGLGTLLGYSVGTLDLSSYFGTTIGSSQFKQVSVIASTTLLLCIVVTCVCVKELALIPKPTMGVKKSKLYFLVKIGKTALRMPKKIQALCWITFWTWIAWSPFHVYSSTWAGEIYFRQNKATLAELRGSADVAGDLARKGSQALFFFSLASFAGSVLLPWIVLAGQNSPRPLIQATKAETSLSTRRIRAFQPDITTAWALSQLLFSASIIWAPFPRSFRFASFIVASCGIPWAMYGWAPLALLGEEINKLETPLHGGLGTVEETTELNRLSLDSNHPSEWHSIPGNEDEVSSPDEGHAAGIYLGIWNIYATIPQFIASFIAMVAFSILEPGRSLEWAQEPEVAGSDVAPRRLTGTAACLVVGAVSSLVAAILTFRLRRM